MITAGNINGNVKVELEGHPDLAVGRFVVPITASLDVETGALTLAPVSTERIIAAASGALIEAAHVLLDTIPVVEGVRVLDGELTGTLITCDDCGESIVYDRPATLAHAADGSHRLAPIR